MSFGTLKSPKLWKRFVPPPGLVPPVMLYWVCPPTAIGPLTWVFNQKMVMGAVACAATYVYANQTEEEHSQGDRGAKRKSCGPRCCLRSNR